MNEASNPRWFDPVWREARDAAVRAAAYAAGKKAGREEAARRLGILEGSVVWNMMTHGNDLQDAVIQIADVDAGGD
jgi:hypothetical protein